MKVDIDKAINHAKKNAEAGSKGLCARYVRLALQAGGAKLDHYPGSAKDYGPTLRIIGFYAAFYWSGSVGQPIGADQSCKIVNQCYQYTPVKGDVIVIQPYKGGGPHGHIAIYSGTAWISDFVQRDMWAGPGYRKAQPPFMVYRQ